MGNQIDSKTGTIVYEGSSVLTKGDHSGMPPRTDAYLPTDERGHIQASSLGGSNSRDNVVPQARDLNHGAYYQMEQGERTAPKEGAAVQSEKIAFAGSQPGGRPDAFMVNDTITFPDGQTQTVHLSFANLTSAEQEAMNAEADAQAADLYDAQPNPGDALRDAMSPEEYGALMEETDAALPSVQDHYAEWDWSGPAEEGPEAGIDAEPSGSEAEADGGEAGAAGSEAEADGGEAGADSGCDSSSDGRD